MTFTGILIGTAILWGLSLIFVQPLTGYLIENRLRKEPGYAHLLETDPDEVTLTEDEEKFINSLATKYYILSDVLVMGVAGFLIGAFSGFFFIGFSFEGKGWPGMIAFITSSIGGSIINAGGM